MFLKAVDLTHLKAFHTTKMLAPELCLSHLQAIFWLILSHSTDLPSLKCHFLRITPLTL